MQDTVTGDVWTIHFFVAYQEFLCNNIDLLFAQEAPTLCEQRRWNQKRSQACISLSFSTCQLSLVSGEFIEYHLTFCLQMILVKPTLGQIQLVPINLLIHFLLQFAVAPRDLRVPFWQKSSIRIKRTVSPFMPSSSI